MVGGDCPHFIWKGKGLLFLAMLLAGSLLAVPLQPLQTAAGENVIFIFPNSKEPSLIQFFDPPIQIIDKGEAIVFVNPDSVDHRLVVKSDNEGGAQVFDTGVLKPNQFAQHAFENYGNYTIECTIYPHMKGEIRVTSDILTLIESIPDQNLDVQLSRSPAFPKVGEDTLFKVTFIDSATGRNRQHIDFALTFEDPAGNYVDGIGGIPWMAQSSARLPLTKKVPLPRK